MIKTKRREKWQSNINVRESVAELKMWHSWRLHKNKQWFKIQLLYSPLKYSHLLKSCSIWLFMKCAGCFSISTFRFFFPPVLSVFLAWRVGLKRGGASSQKRANTLRSPLCANFMQTAFSSVRQWRCHFSWETIHHNTGNRKTKGLHLFNIYRNAFFFFWLFFKVNFSTRSRLFDHSGKSKLL